MYTTRKIRARQLTIEDAKKIFSEVCPTRSLRSNRQNSLFFVRFCFKILLNERKYGLLLKVANYFRS